MSGFIKSDEHANNDSLESQYEAALQAVERLESGELFALSREYRLLHASCLEKLANCLHKVEQLDLFSPNETVEDINTSELKYLNLSYYTAKVIEKTPVDAANTSVDARISLIHLSARKYLEFLTLLCDYGLVEDPNIVKIVNTVLPQGIRGTFNLQAFSKQKQDRRSKVELHRQSIKITKVYEEAKSNCISQGLPDEEGLRELELVRLKYHQIKTWESLNGLVDELTVLGTAAAEFSAEPLRERANPFIASPYLAETVVRTLGASGGPSFNELKNEWDAKQAPVDMSRRVDPLNPQKLTGPRGEIRQPFIITGSNAEARRQQVQSQVFGTGQYLPTVTIEELVEKELAMRAKPDSPKPEQDEDRDEVADALTMKARQWDDFTDSVAKGEGNTLNLG